MGVEPSQVAIVRRRCAEFHFSAQVVLSSLAEITQTAGYARLDCNSVADRQVLDVFAELPHNAGSLMTDNHRSFHDKIANPTMNQVVNVRATNTNAVHLQ